MDNTLFGYIIVGLLIFLGLCFIYWRFRKNFKFLKVPSVCLVTGAPKTGKDLLCSTLSKKDFKRVHRKWVISSLVLKIFRSKRTIEEPLYYTNVTSSFGSLKSKRKHKLDKCIRYLTLDSLLRQRRFNYKSIIYISEGSLVADNQYFNNQSMNIDLSLFCKLIAHETRGGKMYISTQSILDLHYSFKRVCSNFYFIQKSYNLLGLVHVLYVREMISNDLGANNFTDDLDTTTRKVIIPFWWHNKYDRYEFAYFTDDLDKSNEEFVKNGLVSFNEDYIKHADRRKEIKK